VLRLPDLDHSKTSGIEDGLIFRCVTHSGTIWGSGISEKVVSWVVRQEGRYRQVGSPSSNLRIQTDPLPNFPKRQLFRKIMAISLEQEAGSIHSR
jgi:hypothetical protein